MSRRGFLPLLLSSFVVFAAGCGNQSGSGMGGNPGDPSSDTSSAATYAYVSAQPTQGTYQISAFSAGAGGALTPISGSPFSTTGYGPLSMTTRGSMLFGADGYSIDSFSIASNGALHQINSFTAGHLSPSSSEPIGGPVDLFLDTSASTLYDGFANIDGTENNGYQALNFNASGAVSLIGSQGAGPALGGVLAFSGNDQFAYTSSCYHGVPAISGFARGSNGSLTGLAGQGFLAMPMAPSGEGYCPNGAVTDSSNHLILSVGIAPPDGMPPTGPWQLATYSIDGSGQLSTVSTSSTMPTTNVGQPASYQLSPDNKYLAIGGRSGLQVFAYDANTGIISNLGTSGVLTGDGISQVAWDSSDRLYALAPQSNSLYVYSVGSSGELAVSGSPYAVQGAYALTVASGHS
jgi:hypothetical protein